MKNGKSGGKSVGKGKNEWTRAKLFNGLHATAERRAKRTTWIYAKRVNFMFRERATLALPFPCERHGRSDSSSFLLRSRHELKKRNSRVFQHFAPFEIFQRPVEETAERIPRGYFRSFTCFRIKERSMGTCPLSCHRKGFIFSSLSRRMCQVVFHFLRDPSVIKCHFFFPSMIDEIIIIIIVATRVYKSPLNWIIRQ